MGQLELLKKLPKDMFVIGGSYAIKQQDNNFRKPKDIDIMFKEDYYEFIKFTAEKNGWTIQEEGHYELELLSLEKDGCLIHCIPYKVLPEPFIVKDGFNLLHQDKVYDHKKRMLSQYKKGTKEFEKHLYDIGYLYSNKQSDYYFI